MVNEETIYTGNTQHGNSKEGVLKNIVEKAWKPVTIGGSTGILLGAGALMAQHTIALTADAKPATHTSDVENKVETKPVEENVVTSQEEVASDVQSDVHVATVGDDLTFEQAFAEARELVGPGGVFYWHGAVFSTYTADEWDVMTEDEQNHFAEMVRPEVDAHHVDADRLTAADDIEPDSDIDDEGADVYAQVEQDMDQDVADVPVHEANEDFILADIREAESGFALADEVDEDVAIADDDEMVQDLAMLDEDVDEDIALAEPAAEGEDDNAFALNEMFNLKSGDDMTMADGSKSSADTAHRDSFENFISDDVVRIVGYGEFDGHMVRGLDLDGDNLADVAVIDVDDSGDLSRDDIVVEEGNGNMSTYGELHDFAMSQLDEHHDNSHDNMPNPDVAQDMPDYMDDAIAQL